MMLGRYLEVDPREVEFSYGQHGKPALSSRFGSELRFNISHAGGLALFGMTRGAELGVDLEAIRPLPDAEQLAERFFSVREVAGLRALPPARRSESFFNCWTRKEAYVKALGSGLAHPLDRFEVSLAPGEPASLVNVADDPEEAKRWTFCALSRVPGFAGAVVVEGGERRFRSAWWSAPGEPRLDDARNQASRLRRAAWRLEEHAILISSSSS
jgi:4'-phosphopantetheinyl transferase